MPPHISFHANMTFPFCLYEAVGIITLVVVVGTLATEESRSEPRADVLSGFVCNILFTCVSVSGCTWWRGHKNDFVDSVCSLLN